jgi:hypothetical protein
MQTNRRAFLMTAVSGAAGGWAVQPSEQVNLGVTGLGGRVDLASEAGTRIAVNRAS